MWDYKIKYTSENKNKRDFTNIKENKKTNNKREKRYYGESEREGQVLPQLIGSHVSTHLLSFSFSFCENHSYTASAIDVFPILIEYTIGLIIKIKKIKY